MQDCQQHRWIILRNFKDGSLGNAFRIDKSNREKVFALAALHKPHSDRRQHSQMMRNFCGVTEATDVLIFDINLIRTGTRAPKSKDPTVP